MFAVVSCSGFLLSKRIPSLDSTPYQVYSGGFPAGLGCVASGNADQLVFSLLLLGKGTDDGAIFETKQIPPQKFSCLGSFVSPSMVASMKEIESRLNFDDAYRFSEGML